MRLVDQCRGSFDDVAVITPYRVQADAIENAILRRYGAEASWACSAGCIRKG